MNNSIGAGNTTTNGDWSPIEVEGTAFKINPAKLLCTTKSSKDLKFYDCQRKSELHAEDGQPTYFVVPQPTNLPEGWEQLVKLSADSKNQGTFIYYDLEDEVFLNADPRPLVGDDPLPVGWSQSVDEDGDVVFIDHNSGTKTYDDPRLTSDEAPSAKKMFEEVNMTHHGSHKDKPFEIVSREVEEFDRLPQHFPSPQLFPPDVLNKKFNRYLNILPNLETRVKLKVQGGDLTSDYVNANYIPGPLGEPRAYIAAMGPMECTLPAFWRMIWENNVSSIIMATSLVENGINKCARYWPTVRYNAEKNCGDLTYGDVNVAVISGAQRPGYVRTQLRVKKGGETRTIVHFWYTEWPDHGIPSTSKNVLPMIDEARAISTQAGTPTLVHCSAGIGRTGTLIAIDHCINILKSLQRLDVLLVVEKLREGRGGMVQHLQQYEFVTRAIVEFVSLEDRECIFVEAPEHTDLALRCHQLGAPLPPLPAQGQAGDTLGEVDWVEALADGKYDVLETLVASPRPAYIKVEDWEKLTRMVDKHKAGIRARSSMRRRLSDAELHGEVRLTTKEKKVAKTKSKGALFAKSKSKSKIA